MNKHVNSTAPADAASECPYERVRRLSRELAAALDDVDHVTLAMVYPASKHDHPVCHIHDREYARMSRAMLEYRDKHRVMMERWAEFQATPAGQEKKLAAAIQGDSVGYFDAKHACDMALHRLNRAFEVPMIEGETA